MNHAHKGTLANAEDKLPNRQEPETETFGMEGS